MKSSDAIYRDTVDSAEDFVPIALATIRPNSALSFDLYLRTGTENHPLLYRERHTPLEADDIARLIDRGIHSLFIAARDQAAYDELLRSEINEVLDDERIPAAERFSILQECAKTQIDEAIRSVSVDTTIKASQEVGRQIGKLLSGNDLLPGELFQMMRHDYYTFTHLINVSSYAVILAKQLGVTDGAELEAIAVGGLLHDHGKLSMPPTILNKKGPLTSAEKAVMQTHPQIGFVQLRDRPELTWGQLMMVYQHHEAINGDGYPVRCVGDEIDWHARLCAIVDIFDAMTCHRPYRSSMPVDEVNKHLLSLAGKKLDDEMVHCWIEAIRMKR